MSHRARIPIADLIERAMDHPKDDWMWCQGCSIVFDWDKLPDENIISYREYHGEPNLTPEVVPTGWICPECGHKNDL